MNDLLRSHVTRVGFDLSLGKTHIAALVYLDVMIRARSQGVGMHVTDLALRRTFAHFAGGARGCIERGLLLHHYDERYSARGPIRHRDHLGRHYTITKAGKLVLALLREAGIYQEYAAALPMASEVAS